MIKILGPAVLFAALIGCVDQALVDEVETKCDAWLESANSCIDSLNELGGGSDNIDPSQCDEINESAQTSTNANLEEAIDLLDCQIAAYDTDCSSLTAAEEAVEASRACLDGLE